MEINTVSPIPPTEQVKHLSREHFDYWHVGSSLYELYYVLSAYEHGEYGPIDERKQTTSEGRAMTSQEYYRHLILHRDKMENQIIDIVGKIKNKVLTN